MKKIELEEKRLKFKAKDRMVLVNKKNMKKIIKYFNVDDNELYDGDFDLSWAVNYLVNIAVGELKAIDEEHEYNWCLKQV